MKKIILITFILFLLTSCG
ncbi:lipoprotein, partial [Patescibacteria group bacterium]|nr:lipoprotein [Patescibacteria group bacterium]